MMTIPKAVLYNKYTASLFNGATIERESYDYSRRQATVKIPDELDLYFFPTACGILGDWTVLSVEKMMATIFWDSHGAIYFVYVEKNKTFTGTL